MFAENPKQILCNSFVSEKLQIILSRILSLAYFFFKLRLCPRYRFVHEKRPNRRASSDVKLQLMFISKRPTRDGVPFPREKHSCPDWVSRGYAYMYVSLHVYHRMYTRERVWNESGDPKWLLPVASVGLMLHKLCHEVLVQLTNTCLSYQVHYFLINTWIFHFIMKKGVVFPIFQASEFSPSLIRSSGWMSDSVQWRKIVFPKSKQIFYYIKKATGYLFANEAILHYA